MSSAATTGGKTCRALNPGVEFPQRLIMAKSLCLEGHRAIHSEQIGHCNDAENQHGGAEGDPKAELLLQNNPCLRAIPVAQESQNVKPHAARDDGEQHT